MKMNQATLVAELMKEKSDLEAVKGMIPNHPEIAISRATRLPYYVGPRLRDVLLADIKKRLAEIRKEIKEVSP